jgi:hypothetical protein
MIKLPKKDIQSMFDYETFHSLTTNEERLGKFLAHYEAMKIASTVPGDIVECGVFKGTSFVRLALMRQMMGGKFSSKILGFDTFSNIYPNTKYSEDKYQRKYWIKTAGSSSIGKDQLESILKEKKIENYLIVKGDAVKTIPKFKKENPGIKISLLNLDIDFVEPTLVVLKNFYDSVSKGGIILFDNYAGVGNSGKYLHGDTSGIDKFFKNKKEKIRKFPFCARPCYIIKSTK